LQLARCIEQIVAARQFAEILVLEAYAASPETDAIKEIKCLGSKFDANGFPNGESGAVTHPSGNDPTGDHDALLKQRWTIV
jgi:hypothetical protein